MLRCIYSDCGRLTKALGQPFVLAPHAGLLWSLSSQLSLDPAAASLSMCMFMPEVHGCCDLCHGTHCSLVVKTLESRGYACMHMMSFSSSLFHACLSINHSGQHLHPAGLSGMPTAAAAACIMGATRRSGMPINVGDTCGWPGLDVGQMATMCGCFLTFL